MYNRRSKMNPLYNQFVDHQGTAFDEDFVATGFGAHLAMPILRNEWNAQLSLQEAKDLIAKCLKICFYRDCRGYCKVHFAHCDGTTSTIEPATQLDHYWGHPAWNRKTLEEL